MNSAQRLYRKQKRKAIRYAGLRATEARFRATDALLGEGAGVANALGVAAYEETRGRDQMHLRQGGHSLRFRLGVDVADGVRWVQCVECREVFHAVTGDVPHSCPSCMRAGTVGFQGWACPLHGWHDASEPCEDAPLSQSKAVKVGGRVVAV